MPELRIIGIRGIPEVHNGDRLGTLLASGIKKIRGTLESDDVVIVTQKIVSKAEGRTVRLASVTPSRFALDYASRWGKDARQVELVLRESVRVVKMEHGVLITETAHGFVCANSGVDMSNAGEEGVALLLPKDPDASARRIRNELKQITGKSPAVIITDTFGRPWRDGQTNVAIGLAGMEALMDYRGKRDARGMDLRVTLIAVADELAGASELVMGKVDGIPAALVRGYKYNAGRGNYKDLLFKPENDLFR